MDVRRWIAIAQRHRPATILATLMTTFAGVALVLNQPERTSLAWLGLPLVAGGAAMLVWIVWPKEMPLGTGAPSLASRIIQAATWNGRFMRLFPVLGVTILVADLVYNFKLSGTPALQTEDTIAILAALVLTCYGLVPPGFARERDFVLAFVVALNTILVVPLLIARAWEGDFERSVDFYSWVALAPQTGAVLQIFGVENMIHSVAGSTAPGLTFTPQHLSVQVTIVITTACSGIYSFGIFASAFVAFVLTEFQHPARRLWLLLGLGLLASYVANVLRMVIIVLVGYYTDTTETDLQNMLIAHSYAGWLIFLAWVALFWGALFQFLPVHPDRKRPEPELIAQDDRLGCRICGESFSPAILATRCSCGAFYHVRCITASETCRACGSRVGAEIDQTAAVRSP